MTLAERIRTYLTPALRERELQKRIVELEYENRDLAYLSDMYKAERDKCRRIVDALAFREDTK
jgi:hypothetical protein